MDSRLTAPEVKFWTADEHFISKLCRCEDFAENLY